MINIKFLSENKIKNSGGHGIQINELSDKKAYYYSYYKNRYNIIFNDEKVFLELIKHSLSEIGKKFYSIRHSFESKNWDFELETTIAIHKNEYNKAPLAIYIELNIFSEDWSKPYSITEFAQTLEYVIKQKNLHYEYFQDDEDFVTNGFGIKFPILDTQQDLSTLVNNILTITEEILQEVKYDLIQNLDSEVLTSLFSFPEHIKTTCKQYLIYFGQFLMDLGIEAETEIKEESQVTLFKIVPKNKNESLKNIKEALTTYLNTPELENFDITNSSNDLAVIQWQSNMYHLKSQLMLANSIIQLKDATIQSLELSNFQLKNLRTNDNTLNNSEDEEEIIKGVLSVNKYEAKGFSINLPEIIRKLKRNFF